jgi:hypothetical protein
MHTHWIKYRIDYNAVNFPCPARELPKLRQNAAIVSCKNRDIARRNPRIQPRNGV